MDLFSYWHYILVKNPLETVRTFVMAIGTIATVSGGIIVYRNFQINQKRLITDRFSKAVEHLGTTNNRMVVLGGIYALSKIAHDSHEYHWIVMKVIASFIRSKVLEFAPSNSTNSEDYPRVYLEIQEAITVIAKRNYKQDLNYETLDLSGSLLVRAYLKNANFRKINLRDANFGNTNLEGVDFRGANLERAIFYASDLSGAILKEAKLEGARYCDKTKFPVDFDPDVVGMKKE
jgi:hypothetical protein